MPGLQLRKKTISNFFSRTQPWAGKPFLLPCSKWKQTNKHSLDSREGETNSRSLGGRNFCCQFWKRKLWVLTFVLSKLTRNAIFLRILFILWLCVSVCLGEYVQKGRCVCGGQKRKSDSLDLVFQGSSPPLHVYMCLCVRVSVCLCIGQWAICRRFLPCRSQGLNFSYQAWQQAQLPTEPSC